MRSLLYTLKILYEILLRLYPRLFQEEFRGEMLSDFSDMAADAGRKGIFSLILFCLRELIDFPINLLRVHFEEGRIFKILRSQPVNHGLRSGLGFGIAFALTVPISIFVYNQLFFWLDSMELGPELSLWIPGKLSALATGLILGASLALLFADRSQYSRYILVGMLGWFLSHLVGDIFMSFNLWGYLTGIQFWIFDCMVLAFSGAIFGLIFVIVKSEQRLTMHLLTIGAVIYLLFVYLSVKQFFNLFIFNLFIFQAPWRFIDLIILMVILIASVFIIAGKISDSRKLLWVIVTGAVGSPATRLLLLLVGRLIYPQMITLDTTTTHWDISISNLIYGTLFGLFLGLGLGFQKKDSPQKIIV